MLVYPLGWFTPRAVPSQLPTSYRHLTRGCRALVLLVDFDTSQSEKWLPES